MSGLEWYNQGYDEIEKEKQRVEQARSGTSLQEFPGKDFLPNTSKEFVIPSPKLVGVKILPITFWRHWASTPEGKRTFTCLRKMGNCPLCKRGNKAKFRVIWPVLLKVEKEWTPFILMRGVDDAENLRVIEEEVGIYDRIIKVKRTGLDLDTKYHWFAGKEIDMGQFKDKLEEMKNFPMKYAPKTVEEIEGQITGVEKGGEEFLGGGAEY